MGKDTNADKEREDIEDCPLFRAVIEAEEKKRKATAMRAEANDNSVIQGTSSSSSSAIIGNIDNGGVSKPAPKRRPIWIQAGDGFRFLGGWTNANHEDRITPAVE